jgi:hypothetical protein
MDVIKALLVMAAVSMGAMLLMAYTFDVERKCDGEQLWQKSNTYWIPTGLSCKN